MSKADSLAQQGEVTLKQAATFGKITDAEQHQNAIAYLKGIVALKNQISEFCDPNIQKWHEGHKHAIAQKKELIKPLQQAEAIIKKGIVVFRSALEKQQKEARAAAIKKAREEAEEARRLESEALRDAGEHEIADIVEEMPIAPVVVTEKKEAPQSDGVFTRETVVVEVVDKKALVEYIMANWDLFNHWIDIPLKHPRQLAQQQRQSFKVPGIKMVIEKNVQVRT